VVPRVSACGYSSLMARVRDEMQPGNRRPAPPPLDLVQAFVNSRDREAGVELFDSTESLAAWLRSHDLITANARITRRDLAAAIELRETIRQLLLEHNGEPASAGAHTAFARVAARTVLTPQIDADGAIILSAPGGGAPAALSSILAAIAHASAVGTWSRLKACRSDVCQWAFYDHSKNRSSHWCTMEICGARAKMRRYRQRRAADRPISFERVR
jgi:predicted RNA-binding Zn ribbon-like protein